MQRKYRWSGGKLKLTAYNFSSFPAKSDNSGCVGKTMEARKEEFGALGKWTQHCGDWH